MTKKRMALFGILLAASCGAIAWTHAGDDPTVDWLMSKAATRPTSAPSTKPATQPGSPLNRTDADDESRKGTLTLSDGKKIPGRISTTAGRPLRVYVDEKSGYRDIPFAIVRKAEAKILWEREEREWHFKESGSDIKEYSGKTYPAREYAYVFTLLNGQTVTGSIAAPLYLEDEKSERTFVLHKRDKGDIGKTLKDLIYVRTVEFED